MRRALFRQKVADEVIAPHDERHLELHLRLRALRCEHDVVRLFFFFNDTATTEIYTTHNTLPYTTLFRSKQKTAYEITHSHCALSRMPSSAWKKREHVLTPVTVRYLVCRLLLEKKNYN